MDIFEFALQMERESEEHYRKMALETSHKGFQNIFKMLADSERNHYATIEKLRDKQYGDISLELLDEPGDIWVTVMPDSDTVQLKEDEVELYRQIMASEDKASDYYLKQADEAEDDEAKEVFLALAHQEQKHSMLMENIIDHINEYMDNIEDPEFTHRKAG